MISGGGGGGGGGQVETVAAGSGGESELFHSVDEVGAGASIRRRLDDERLIFECDEAPAETEAQF